MTDKCANPKCCKPLVHIEGRRKKKYCDQVCNSKHWQATHYVPSNRKRKFKTIPIEQYNEMLEKIAVNNLPENKAKIWAERNGTPKETKVQNPLIPDECENTNQELITKYQTELSHLGSSQIAKGRRKWINKQLQTLKK